MKNPHNLEVGQKLYRVQTRDVRGEPDCYFVEITKIGRKWATVKSTWDEEKVGIKNLEVDGGEYSSPARCFLDKEAYESHYRIKRIYNLIRCTLPYQIDERITEAGIKEAAKLLMIEIPEKCVD